MAQQQREALVAGGPVPSVNLVIHQPLIGAAYGNRNSCQQIAARKCEDESRKPGPRVFPETGLPAENQAEDIEEPSPGVLVRLQQIAQYRVAFIPLEEFRGKAYQLPGDSVHDVLPVRFCAQEAPRLTRMTAS